MQRKMAQQQRCANDRGQEWGAANHVPTHAVCAAVRTTPCGERPRDCSTVSLVVDSQRDFLTARHSAKAENVGIVRRSFAKRCLLATVSHRSIAWPIIQQAGKKGSLRPLAGAPYGRYAMPNFQGTAPMRQGESNVVCSVDEVPTRISEAIKKYLPPDRIECTNRYDRRDGQVLRRHVRAYVPAESLGIFDIDGLADAIDGEFVEAREEVVVRGEDFELRLIPTFHAARWAGCAKLTSPRFQAM
jgi:hypothetical protein